MGKQRCVVDTKGVGSMEFFLLILGIGLIFYVSSKTFLWRNYFLQNLPWVVRKKVCAKLVEKELFIRLKIILCIKN